MFFFSFYLRKGDDGVVVEDEDGRTGQSQPFHCRNPAQVSHSLHHSAMEPEAVIVIRSCTWSMVQDYS